MQPRIDSTGRFFDWTATATYGRILTGVVGVMALVPPARHAVAWATPLPVAFAGRVAVPA